MKASLRFFGLMLIGCLTLVNASALGQSSLVAPAAGSGSSGSAVASGGALDSASARLIQLMEKRPEVAGLLKGYLDQRLKSEGVDVEEKLITKQMLVERIQSDPKFAWDASRWLTDLAAQTSASLQTVQPNDAASAATGMNQAGKPAAQPARLATAQVPSELVAPAKAAPAAASAGAVPSVTSKGSEVSTSGFAATAGGSVGALGSTKTTSLTNADTPVKLTVRDFPKNLLQDQVAFWTQPLHLDVQSLSFLVPATFGTAALIGMDTDIESHLPKSPNTIKMAANGSTAGMLALVGAGGGLYLMGQATHDEHKIETGYLVGEAAIDAYASSTAMQYMTQRERPFTGNNKGQFLDRKSVV